jgi:hypothetical protein
MFLSEMVASVRGSPVDPLEGKKKHVWWCTPPGGETSREQARVVLAQGADPAEKRTMSAAREHSSTLVGIPEDVGSLSVVRVRHYGAPCSTADVEGGEEPVEKKTGQPKLGLHQSWIWMCFPVVFRHLCFPSHQFFSVVLILPLPLPAGSSSCFFLGLSG